MASMQGGRCISESFHNIVDLNEQLVLSTSNLNHSAAWWSDLLNPGRQDTGKFSLVTKDQIHGDDLTIGKDLFAPTSSSSTCDAMLPTHSYQPKLSGSLFESESNHGSNRVMKRVSHLSGSGSDYYPRNTNLCGDGGLRSTYSNSYTSGGETPERLTHDSSLNNHDASYSSRGYLINNGDKSGSSLVSAGKRKTPEDGHTQLYSGGGLHSRLQAENYMQHTVPAAQNASGSIATAPSPEEWSFIGQQEQLNLSIGIGKREAYSEGSRAQMYASGSSSTRLPAENTAQHTVLTSQDASESITTVASPMEWSLTSQPEQLSVRFDIEERETYSEFFPPPNITDMAVFSAENIGERLNFGQQEPNLFDFMLTDTALRPSSSSSSSANHPSRSLWSTDSSLICNPSSLSNEFRVPENTGSMIPSYVSGPLDPQSGRLLKSLRFSGGRATAFGDAQNSGNILLQDSPALNSASGIARLSESFQPSSRSGSNLRMQNIPTGGTPPQNWAVPNQQGLTQHSPQFPLQSFLPNYGNQRGYFPVIPPTPISLMQSSIPPCSSQGRQNQSSRSALLIGDLPGPTSRQRGLAGQTRNRQVRQVRNTVQRGDNRRVQNVAVEVAEDDRHRDMRLDIDNMSYEELLALEERIGNVCTGLSEEVIMRCMKRRKHLPVSLTSTSEPCSICQEEFVAGDEIGATVCKHEFHFKCIKQWLLQKNVCPICKKTALNT